MAVDAEDLDDGGVEDLASLVAGGRVELQRC
jgi:hypothetical protein